ncbi:MAG: DUF1704 domain-containing protein [Deltaproteobacteria bacterium]|nr:DUF1704 domain-containing protein [Deltaproteobacteria bacterium]
MTKNFSQSKLVLTLKEANEVFKGCAKKSKILAALSWSPEVVTEFFSKKESVLPKPVYFVDKAEIKSLLEQLKALEPKLQGEHPLLAWLRRTLESYQQGMSLLTAIETDRFFDISTQMYGSSGTKIFKGETTNLELAKALTQRISVCSLNDIGENFVKKSAVEFAASLEEKIKLRSPNIPLKVELTDTITSKVVAGMNKVKLRKDARFSELELEALWNHEVESHCLTAHNGNRQPYCDFVSAGGPRTTLTQEGLAVFYEVYAHTMSQNRFLSLCHRVEAVSLAESGASFLDVYRWYKDRTDTPLEAFFNTQRIFRGAKLTGGGAFTKDVVYLSGLLGVYNFLKLAVKNQNRILVESLVCGRMALEDVSTIAWLRTHGIIQPPYFIPAWLKNWEGLLSFFSLTAVFDGLDLSNVQNYLDDQRLHDWDVAI